MDGKYDFPMEICLNDTQAKDELKAFHKLVSSSMGPRGHLKMVLSLADTMIVTSSSDRLFDFMRLDSPLVEILVSTSKSLSDFRLYFCSLAVQLLDVQDKFGNKTVDLSVLPDILEKARIKIDIGDVFSLMSLITTNLTSKVGTGLLKNEINKISNLILKAWLMSIRSDESLGDVYVRVLEGGGGLDQPSGDNGVGSILEGFLYRLTEEEEESLQALKAPIKVCLYDCMLDKDQSGEGWERTKLYYRSRTKKSKKYSKFVDSLKSAGVQLFACRKVVCAELVDQLQDSGIFVLSRLGTDGFYRLEQVAGGIVQTSVHASFEPCFAGKLNFSDIIQIRSTPYLHLNNTGCGQINLDVFGTLTEQNRLELKLQVQKSIQALQSLVTQTVPLFVPGGGCLETRIALSLLNPKGLKDAEQRNQLAKIFFNMAAHFQTQQTYEIYVDVKFGHLWKSASSLSCACGLIHQEAEASESFMDNIIEPGTLRVSLMELLNRSELKTDLHNVVIVKHPHFEREKCAEETHLLVDSWQIKSAAFLSAVESATSLHNISSILNI